MKKTVLFSLLLLLSTLIAAGQSTVVVFSVTGAPANESGKVGIRGNVAPLSWEETRWLTAQPDGRWTTSIAFPAGTDLVEYKYVTEDRKGTPIWELDGYENRLLLPDVSASVSEQWNEPRPVEAANLPKLSPEALAEDFAILKQAYRDLHPGLYRYNDEQAMEKHFQALEKALSRELSYAEAYLEISKFLGKIQCGHTYANFFNQSGLIQQIILGRPDKLPFAFRLIDRRMIVTKNASQATAFEPGVEILAVNGVPVPQILDSLLTVVKADGAADAKRLKDLEVTGYDYFESFDVYFPLFFPPIAGQFAVEGRNLRTDEPVNATVEAIARRERTARIQQRYGDLPTSLDDLWEFKVLDGKTGYLKLGTFTVWNFEMDWKAFLKNAFKTLDKEKIGRLIIDIRGNEGGADEVIYELGKYLVKEPCSVETFQERIRYEKIPKDLQPYLFTWDKTIFDLTGQVERLDDRFYVPKEAEADMQQLQPSKQMYEGKVYFLIGPANSSATFYLSRIAKACNIATLVGQETGGSRRGLNAGIMFFLRLPNSRIEADLPVLGNFPRSEQPAGGIVPDILVEPDVRAVLEGRDPELEAALRAIGRE
jgi:C-terminal processing protease CtpA/Prc